MRAICGIETSGQQIGAYPGTHQCSLRPVLEAPAGGMLACDVALKVAKKYSSQFQSPPRD